MSVLQVSAGAEHSLLLTDLGHVLSFGCGTFGRLGHGDEQSQPLPVPIQTFARSHTRVVAVFAGSEHNLALTAANRVYSWGNGQCGRLGTATLADTLIPTPVTALDGIGITHVSAGLAHSLVTDVDGVVHAFGWGAFGQLGLGTSDDVMIPTPIAALAGVKIVQTSAGAQHSLFLSATGAVYSCGKATRGRLGLGDNTRRLLPTCVSSLSCEVVNGTPVTVQACPADTPYAWGLHL